MLTWLYSCPNIQTMLPTKRLFQYSFLLVSIAVAIVSCKPKEDCNEGQICLTNSSSTNTKFFYWFTSDQLITLAPGNKICNQTGPVKIVSTLGGNQEATFGSYSCVDGTSVSHLMESCNEEAECECFGENLTKFCDNGLFDPTSGENNVDCGGNCRPCDEFVDLCELYKDSITMDDQMGDNAALTSIFGRRVSGNYIEMRFEFNSSGPFFNNRTAILTARIHADSLPLESRIYTIGSGQEELSLIYDRGIVSSSKDYWYSDTSQTVQLIKTVNGVWRLNLCNISFHNLKFDIERTATCSGQVIFSKAELELD